MQSYVMPTLRVLVVMVSLNLYAQASHATNLMEAYRLARESDRQWRYAQARHLESREFIPQARSQLLPAVSVNASESRNNQQLTTGNVSRPEQKYPSSTRAVTMRQPLLITRQLDGLSQAEARARQADMNLLEEEQQLTLRLVDAYFNHLLSLDRKAALDAQKAFVTARLEAAIAALRAGQGTRNDVDDATAELDRLRANEIQVEQSTQLTRRQLEIITGRPLQEIRPLRTAGFNTDTLLVRSLEDVMVAALTSNRSLLAAREDVKIARASLSQIAKGHLPTLDLVVQANQGTGENQFFATTTSRNRSIALQFALPIYSGGLVQSQERQAAAKLTQAEEQVEGIANTLRVQIQTEHDGLRHKVALLTALQTAARSAEQALLSSQKGQIAGVRSTLDILRADSQRSQVKLELAQARYDLLKTWLKLKGLEGNLGEQELALINALID
jgi:protease secretion system outer membrane protein